MNALKDDVDDFGRYLNLTGARLIENRFHLMGHFFHGFEFEESGERLNRMEFTEGAVKRVGVPDIALKSQEVRFYSAEMFPVLDREVYYELPILRKR
jgi:hypothetical protein